MMERTPARAGVLLRRTRCLFLAPDAETWVWLPILEWALARKANPEPF